MKNASLLINFGSFWKAATNHLQYFVVQVGGLLGISGMVKMSISS